MPLVQSSSRSAVGENIRREQAAGKPHRQAIAIALDIQRRNRRAAGGAAPQAPTYQTGAPAVNSSGFVPVPQGGTFNLDLTSGAMTPGSLQALQGLAQRGIPIAGMSGPAPLPPSNPAPVDNGSFTTDNTFAPAGNSRQGGAIRRVSGGAMLEERNGRRLQPYDELLDEERYGGWHPYMARERTGNPNTDPNMQTVAPLSFDANEVWRGQTSGLGQRTTVPPDPQDDARGGAIRRASGGSAPPMGETPWWIRREASGMDRAPSGLIPGTTGGRADAVPMNLAPHSHVIPADVVSGWGQGNTSAGAANLQHALSTGPFGLSLPRVPSRGPKLSSPPRMPHMARGGAANGIRTMVSPGEVIVPPEDVHRIGSGDFDKGHDWIDRLIVHSRKQIIHHMRKLPPPVKE